MKTISLILLLSCFSSVLTFECPVCSQPIGAPPQDSTAHLSAAKQSAAATGYIMSAQPDKQEYMGGEAIMLNIGIKNTTSSDLFLPAVGIPSPLQQFAFEVTTGDGKPVPLTAFGKIILKPSTQNMSNPATQVLGVTAGPIGSYVVNGGSEEHYHFLINRLYDMSKSGTYHVVVRRPGVPKRIGKGFTDIVSDTVDVVVGDPPLSFYNPNNF